MPILDAVRKFIRGMKDYCERERGARRAGATEFLDELFVYFPFTPEAQRYLRTEIRIEVLNPQSTSGGGGWLPHERLVRLNTAQYEAAIHELAHAIWHERRRDRRVRDALVVAVHRLAEDPDPRWERMRTLARHYVYGIPSQPGFEHGMLLPRSEWGQGGGPQGEWNDWEMFAGLASGCMGDIRLLPPYLRVFYTDIFQELPVEVPPPELTAPHR